MRHKLQSPPKEAKKEDIATEPSVRNPAMANIENELAYLRTLLHDKEKQFTLYKQKLESIQRGRDLTTVRRKAAELALEKAIKEHTASKEEISAELSLAQYQVSTRNCWFKSSDEVKKLREESKAQWQWAHEAPAPDPRPGVERGQ